MTFKLGIYFCDSIFPCINDPLKKLKRDFFWMDGSLMAGTNHKDLDHKFTHFFPSKRHREDASSTLKKGWFFFLANHLKVFGSAQFIYFWAPLGFNLS